MLRFEALLYTTLHVRATVNRFFESRVYTKGCNVQFTHIAVLSIAAKITGVLLYISGGCLF